MTSIGIGIGIGDTGPVFTWYRIDTKPISQKVSFFENRVAIDVIFFNEKENNEPELYSF